MVNNNALKLEFIMMMANNWEFNNNDVHIARKILENYNDIPKYSLDKLTRILHVSKSVFKKFYEQLGYHSYSELKEDVLFTKVVRKKQFMNRYRNFDLVKNKKIFEQFIDNEIDLNLIDAICKEIYNTDKIIFYGSPTLLTKLLDFQLDMQIFGKVVITSSLNDGKVLTPNRNDLVCICSATGRVFNSCAMEMKKNVINSTNKKVVFCRVFTFNEDIDYVLETKTDNDYYEMHNMYVFYLDLIITRYYERYIKKK